jgi:hypothetical protein
MRAIAGLAIASIAIFSSCGGDGNYAGLSRTEAVRAAKEGDRIASGLGQAPVLRRFDLEHRCAARD